MRKHTNDTIEKTKQYVSDVHLQLDDHLKQVEQEYHRVEEYVIIK